MSQCTVISHGYGSFGSANLVITQGYSSATVAEGKQGIFGLEDGMNSTIFNGMVMR